MASDSIGRQGVSLASVAFEKLNFAFREQPTSDFGIDAQVEVRVGSSGAGELLALQIKSGQSYFRESTAHGWWVRTDHKHALYWLTHTLPVILVAVDLETSGVFWEAVTNETVQFTRAGAKILIHKDRRVEASSVLPLLDLLSPSRSLGPPAAEGAECRVFLGRGISGREGWEALARILISELADLGYREGEGCDIVVELRTNTEEESLSDESSFVEKLVSIEVDASRKRATYQVSSLEVESMDLTWDVESRAKADADAIIQCLTTAEELQ